jgi:membrane-associated phospholipid phosphatase
MFSDRSLRRRLISMSFAALLLFSLSASRASAQAAPERFRSGAYYGIHGGLTATFLVGTLVARRVSTLSPGGDPTWFPGDIGVRSYHSVPAARLSDALLALDMVIPVAGQVGLGVDERFLNSSVVYAETLSLNLMLNAFTKVVFRRPRPYSQRVLALGRASNDDDDLNVSFYSGHSSMSFAAALSGSFLFAEATPSRGSRYAMWGAELTLASAVAGLRVRAGKHYFSDVIVGGVVGAGLGVAVPVLHGARYVPEPAEFAVAGGGLVLGAAVAALLPLSSGRSVFDSIVDGSLTLTPFSPGGMARGMSLVGTF